jgi:hypothetical protein
MMSESSSHSPSSHPSYWCHVCNNPCIATLADQQHELLCGHCNQPFIEERQENQVDNPNNQSHNFNNHNNISNSHISDQKAVENNPLASLIQQAFSGLLTQHHLSTNNSAPPFIQLINSSAQSNLFFPFIPSFSHSNNNNNRHDYFHGSEANFQRLINQLFNSPHSNSSPTAKNVLLALKENAKKYDTIEELPQTDCAICQDSYSDDMNGLISILPCKHCYHWDCIHEWLRDHSTCCPICRCAV